MKISNLLNRVSFVLTIAFAAGVGGLPLGARAADDSKPVSGQSAFASPDDAIQALRQAAEAQDSTAMDKIFGSGAALLRTGDKVLDAEHHARFANSIAEKCESVQEGDSKITLEIGTNNWPFPIPLVKVNSQWHFDTEAGREEIINRHIGSDELHAIGVCETYVEAQKQYASMNSQGGEPIYATKFKSSSGKKDGLYWETASGEPPSPLGALVAEAHAEGYGQHHGSAPHPYHGYYFRILTRQGKDAPGGKVNYMHHGHLTRGFALVAYPEHWDRSGVMTFIVNQDGKIYQRNLGEKTREIGGTMKDYNPDSDWTTVEDKGIYEN